MTIKCELVGGPDDGRVLQSEAMPPEIYTVTTREPEWVNPNTDPPTSPRFPRNIYKLDKVRYYHEHFPPKKVPTEAQYKYERTE